MTLDLPSHFRHVEKRLFAEYSLSLKAWDAPRAKSIVEQRIRDVEHQFYTNLALQSYLSHPPNRIRLIRGENPFSRPDKKEEQSPGILHVVEGAGLAAGAVHLAGLHHLVPYASWAGAMYLPARAAVQRFNRIRKERLQHPLTFGAKDLIRHKKPANGKLSDGQLKDNLAHLRKKMGTLHKEYEQLHLTLKWLDTLHALLGQPGARTPDILEKWKAKGALQVFGNRIGWWLTHDASVPSQAIRPELPQTIHWNYGDLTMQRHDFRKMTPEDLTSADELKKAQKAFPWLKVESTPEEAWIAMQKRLDKDDADYAYAMEVHLDLAEHRRATSHLATLLKHERQINRIEKQLLIPRLSEKRREKLNARADAIRAAHPTDIQTAIEALKARVSELRRKYPDPAKTRRQLEDFLDGKSTRLPGNR